jgi:hypothetical protein
LPEWALWILKSSSSTHHPFSSVAALLDQRLVKLASLLHKCCPLLEGPHELRMKGTIILATPAGKILQ